MTTPIPDKIDRARGIMLGLAIGDALGSPIEFIDLEKIKKTYGPRGIQDYNHGKGMFTDDTQMSIAVAEALLEAGQLSTDELMGVVSRKFVEWYDSPDNFRAPGISTKLACRRLKEGVPWQSAGDTRSKGCGSVMRTAPVGFYFHKNIEKLRETAHNIGLATHRHPTADAACLGASLAAALALDGVPPAEWLARILDFTAGISDEFNATMLRVQTAVGMEDEEKAIAHIGEVFKGWTADEVLGIALFSVIRHPDDFAACVLRSVNNSGDSDSIGCVAGALIGARLGVSAIPEKWIQGIERRQDLETLGDKLAAAAA